MTNRGRNNGRIKMRAGTCSAQRHGYRAENKPPSGKKHLRVGGMNVSHDQRRLSMAMGINDARHGSLAAAATDRPGTNPDYA